MKTGTLACLIVVAGVCSFSAGCQKADLRGAVPDREAAKKMRMTLAKADAGGGGSSNTATQTRTGWATLKGRIHVVGDVPPAAVVNITKDTEICRPGGAPVLAQTVLVDPGSKGLANVLFYALDLEGDNVHEDAKGGKTDEVLYDQKNCVYLTHVMAVQTTQVLRIKNSDSKVHNTIIGPFNQNVPPGSTITYNPKKEKKKPDGVSCAVHPWMKAYLLPRKNGYFAKTDKDGNFEIRNLPAGIDLSIQAWHEKLGTKFSNIKVEGAGPTWKRGRIPLKLEPDTTVEIDVEIPATAFQ